MDKVKMDKDKDLDIDDADIDFSVIHLRRSKERSANILAMKEIVPQLYVHEATDARKLRKEEIRRLQADGIFGTDVKYDHVCRRPFTKQHLAIWLSHVRLWEHLVNMPNPKAYHIIFEDDAIIQPRFRVLLSKYWSRMKKMNFAHLYIFPFQLEHHYKLKRKGVHKRPRILWGTQCYFVPHEVLKDMLENIKPLQTAIDEQIIRLPMKGCYLIYDDFVRHGVIKSENKYKDER